jgi:outer membrane protein TolC
MKTMTALCIAMIGLVASHAQTPASIEEIVRKRDALLTQIMEDTQKQLRTGTATAEQVRDARLALWSFRRDQANAQPERVKWQKQIVAFETEWLKDIKKRIAVGTSSPSDAMRAEEQMLAAEQKLLELQLTK